MTYYQQTQSFQAFDHATSERTKGPSCHARQQRPSRRHYRWTDPEIEALHAQTERTLSRNSNNRAKQKNPHPHGEGTGKVEDRDTQRNRPVQRPAEMTLSLQKLRPHTLALKRQMNALEPEIDRVAEKFKEIVSNITTRREELDRKLLKEMGISATIVLMALFEVYQALQETLKQLANPARIAFGTQFGLQGGPSAIGDDTTFELETKHSLRFGTSSLVYYAFYYQP